MPGSRPQDPDLISLAWAWMFSESPVIFTAVRLRLTSVEVNLDDAQSKERLVLFACLFLFLFCFLPEETNMESKSWKTTAYPIPFPLPT